METIEPSKRRGIWRYLGGLLGIAIVIAFLVMAKEQREWLLDNLGTMYAGISCFFGIIVCIYIVYSRSERKEYLIELGAGMGLFASPKEDYPAFSKKIKWSMLLAWSGLRESEPKKIRYLMQGHIDVADVAIF